MRWGELIERVVSLFLSRDYFVSANKEPLWISIISFYFGQKKSKKCEESDEPRIGVGRKDYPHLVLREVVNTTIQAIIR